MFVKSFLFIGVKSKFPRLAFNVLLLSLLIIGCSSTQTSLKDKPSVTSEFSPLSFPRSAWERAGTQTSLKDRPRVVDPVCAYFADMGCVNVILNDFTPKSVYNGTTYYFCNEECKEDFDKHPEKYLKKGEKAPKGSVDPVCKMSANVRDNSPYCIDNGNKVFFCSDHCRSKYLASPERYR